MKRRSRYDNLTDDELVAEYERLGKVIKKRAIDTDDFEANYKPVDVTITVKEEPSNSPASQAATLLGSLFMGVANGAITTLSIIVWIVIIAVVYSLIFD